jgi:predicted anti-sigma-YlaC factor YlaD
MKLLTSCKQAARTLSEGLDRPLPFHRRLGLSLHLMMCAACRQYRRQVIGLNRLVRRYACEEPPPVDLDAATRRRLVERLHQAGGTPVDGQPKV